MMFVGAYESYGLSLNWTKVGLKDHRGRVGYSILIRLNWTKVGLKDGVPVCAATGQRGV